MCPKPLEVTRTSLATCYTSLCTSSSRNPYSLSKCLLVKHWWYLASTSWTLPTSSPSTSHLHMSNGKLKFNVVSLRHKHSPKTLFIYKKIFYAQSPCIHRNFKTIIHYTKSKSTTKILFLKDFISFDFFFFFIFEKKTYEQCLLTVVQTVTETMH